MNLSESIVFCFAEERQLAIDKMSFGYLLFSFFEVIYIYIYKIFFYLQVLAFSAKPQIWFSTLLFFTQSGK